jgi:hypothetical protein
MIDLAMTAFAGEGVEVDEDDVVQLHAS